jgi:hypothetical protein
MIMRWLIVLALLATSSAAQGDHFITYTRSASTPQQANVIEIDQTAATLRTLMTLGGDLFPRQIVMNDDNHSYRLVGNDPFHGYSGFVYDITPGGVITTVVHGPPLINPFALLRGDDGNWILFDRRSFSLTNVYRLDGSTLNTMVSVNGLSIEGLQWNPENGHVIARAWITPVPPYDQPGYFEIDLATGLFTTLVRPPAGSNFSMQYGARKPIYRPGSGEFFDPLYDPTLLGMQLFRVAPGMLTAFTQPLFVQHPTDFVRAGGRSYPVEYHLFTNSLSIPTIYSILQVRGDGHAVKWKTRPSSAQFDHHAPLLRIGSRHLTWFAGATATRRRLSVDFPGEGGRPYMVGVSTSGLRPALTLPDGRVIPLAIDGVTFASLGGALPGILDGAKGQLDAKGHATVILDWTALGGGVSGMRLWAVAIVIDPVAASSVAHISDPLRLQIP